MQTPRKLRYTVEEVQKVLLYNLCNVPFKCDSFDCRNKAYKTTQKLYVDGRDQEGMLFRQTALIAGA